MKVKKSGQWQDIGGSTLFRGEWGPDEVVWSTAFPDGAVAPWTVVSSGTVNQPAISGESTAPWSSSIRLSVGTPNPLSEYSGVQLDIGSLGLSGVTRAAFYVNHDQGGQASYFKMQVMVNGAEAWADRGSSVLDWVEHEVGLDSDDILQLRHAVWVSNSGVSSAYGCYYTGVRIFATEQPYMLNEFVTHDGNIWKSQVDNNPDEPGTSAAWTKVVELPSPYGTTAARPDPVAAGTGYEYFDTDLGRPVWSDGTGWVDATGTTV